MKVLFVCSGNNKYENSPIVIDQGNSLVNSGVDIEYFFIRGKGVWGYLKNLIGLRLLFKKNRYDIVHAHYSLSGIISSLAGGKPLVVSLMGSDVHCHKVMRWLIRMFNRKYWGAMIVKSDGMKDLLGISSAQVIPNGVDLERFQPRPQNEAKSRVGFDTRKHVIFVGNPARPEKNYFLARNAINFLDKNSVVLDVVTKMPHEKLPDYLNAADVLLLTSKYEGSPNVIKEAMACNCPIVATDVGDIRWVLGEKEGCFIASFSKSDVAEKIKKALAFGKRTNGRDRLIELNLDQVSIAVRIVQLYTEVMKTRTN